MMRPHERETSDSKLRQRTFYAIPLTGVEWEREPGREQFECECQTVGGEQKVMAAPNRVPCPYCCPDQWEEAR
jgi:hypothetical protein